LALKYAPEINYAVKLMLATPLAFTMASKYLLPKGLKNN
jgi:hypothetical protein